MILTLLFVFFLLAILLRWRRRRRSAATFFVLALLLLFGAGCGPLPAWLLGRLQSPYAHSPAIDWAPRNAIVLLGAGTARVAANEPVEAPLFGYGRILRAAMLYRDCKSAGRACMLLISGGDAMHLGRSEAAVYGDVLLKLGVDPADLREEGASMNTWQNAQFCAPLLQAYGAQQTVLVSSGLHLQRALLYFGHFGMRPTPVRGDYAQVSWSLLPQAWNLALTDLALHEITGVWRYRFYETMGWNAPAVRPGAT